MKATLQQPLAYADLMAVPYAEGGDDPRTGLDCWGQCRELLRRGGRRVPDIDRIAADPSTAAEVFTLMRRTLPGPLEVCDVIVSAHRNRLHVYTVVDAQQRLALSVECPGGAYLRPVRIVEGLIGVYRSPKVQP